MLRYSLRFYQYNRKMTRSAVLSVLIGMITLVVTLLIVRGSMMTKYEDGAEYNFIALNISEKDYQSMKSNPIFSQVGILREEGKLELAGEVYDMVSADEKSIDIYHQRCLKGRFPKEADEIAAPKDFFTKLGMSPKIGDKVTLHPVLEGKETQCQYVICGILDNVDRYWDNPIQSEFAYPEVFVGQSNKGDIVCVLLTERDDVSEVYTFLDEGNYVYCDPEDKTGKESEFLSNVYASSQDAVRDGIKKAKKDFESAILIPLFSLIISLLVIVLVFCSFKSLYQKRMKTFSLMGLWGMSKRRMMGLLIGESGVLIVLSIASGLILGIIVYKGILLFQNTILGMTVESGLEVNTIISAVTLHPFIYPALVIFFSSLFSLIAVIGYMELPSVSGKVKKSRIRRRRNACKTYDGQLFHMLRIKKRHVIIICAVVALIFSCLYFGSLYIYAKYDANVSSQKLELADLGLEDLDYLSNKNFTLAQYEGYNLNRHDRGITEDGYNRIKKEKAVDSVKAMIEIPSMKVIDDGLSGKCSKYSIADFSSEFMEEGFDELIEKSQKKHGYSMKDYNNMYNIPMVAVHSKQVGQHYGSGVISGSVNIDNINSGKEVLLVVASEGEKPDYKVGDKVHFTDLKIDDKDIEDYNLSTKNIPDNIEPDFSYNYYIEETGETVKQDAYAFGSRCDFEADVGAIVELEDFYDDFYYTDNLLLEQADFYFVTSINGVKQFGIADHNYTKLGVKLKDKVTNKMETDFEKAWYNVCNANTDMMSVSSKEVKEKIGREQTSHFFIVLLLFIILILFSFLLIRSYIKIKRIECQINIDLLSYLGCRKYDITRIFLKILLLSEIAAGMVGWITLYFYEKRILNIYKLCGSTISMQDLLKGNEGILQMSPEISSQINNGGFANLFTYPYIKFYFAVLFVETIVIGIICIFETKGIAFSGKRRKNYAKN